jgi:hypothetical protein
MKLKLILLFSSIIILVVAIFILLSYFDVIHFSLRHPFGGKGVLEAAVRTEDPFLLEKENLKKQWDILAAKETALEKRQEDINQQNISLQEKIKEVNKLQEEINNTKAEQQKALDEKNSRDNNMRSLATKVSSVPPSSGAQILNDLDTAVAVDVIQTMDQIAKEQGKQTSSAYLISLMEPQKRQDLLRMLSIFPTPVKPLDEDSSQNQ